VQIANAIIIGFMNGFLEKTKQNLTSAQILLDQCHYSSSVHCAFYGCLQTLLYVLFVKLKYDKDKFDVDLKFKKTGTHQHVFELIQEKIKKKDESDYHWFKKTFHNLKKLRERADYSEESISQSEGHDALNKAATINNLINKLP
jgi:uncharacterized protein (UPF0332 family)